MTYQLTVNKEWYTLKIGEIEPTFKPLLVLNTSNITYYAGYYFSTDCNALKQTANKIKQSWLNEVKAKLEIISEILI